MPHQTSLTGVLKVVFLLFIMMMSIVLINLIIGLSISDIAALRKEAHVHKLINTVAAIQSVESLHQLLGWALPRLATDTRVTTNNTGDRAIDEQVVETTINCVHKSQAPMRAVSRSTLISRTWTTPQ